MNYAKKKGSQEEKWKQKQVCQQEAQAGARQQHLL